MWCFVVGVACGVVAGVVGVLLAAGAWLLYAAARDALHGLTV